MCLITNDSLVLRHIRVRDEIDASFTPPVVYFLHTTTAPHILASNFVCIKHFLNHRNDQLKAASIQVIMEKIELKRI